jgi:hypothetical protein
MIRFMIFLQNPCLKLILLGYVVCLELRKMQLWGGFHTDLIPPLKSLESCVDGGVLEPQVMMVHPTFIANSRSVS